MTTIEQKFETINEHRLAITISTASLNAQIQSIDDQVDEMIADLMDERSRLVKAAAEISDPHDEKIEALTEEIKQGVLADAKSCKSEYGTCTYVKGRKGSIKWVDEALLGAIAANPDFEGLMQFRSEGPEGSPSVRFSLVEV